MEKNILHLPHPYPLKIDGIMLKKILYIGIPNRLENSMFQLGKIVVLSLVAGYGTASLAANAVCNNVVTFAILPGMSIFSMWVFRSGFSVLLGSVFHLGVFGVWVAMTIDWLVRAVCFIFRYRGGKWERMIFS